MNPSYSYQNKYFVVISTETLQFLIHRWSEVTKRLRLDVTIQELTDDGIYDNVEIIHNPEVSTIGVFQLKQVSDIVCIHLL